MKPIYGLVRAFICLAAGCTNFASFSILFHLLGAVRCSCYYSTTIIQLLPQLYFSQMFKDASFKSRHACFVPVVMLYGVENRKVLFHLCLASIKGSLLDLKA